MTATVDLATATDEDITAALTIPADTPTGPDGDPAEARQEVAEQWARWLRGATREKARIDAIADARIADLKAEIAYVETRRAELVGPVQARIDSLTGALTAWALAYRERTTKATAKLLYATVSTRAVKARAKVSDRKAALAWAKQQRPDMVRTVVPDPYEEVDTTALLAYVMDTGDIVDGVEVVPAETTARVEVITDDPAKEA